MVADQRSTEGGDKPRDWAVPGKWLRFEPWLFWGLLGVSVLPVVLFGHFPSEDGPLHLANASAYLNSASPVFAEYFDYRSSLIPNLSADYLLAGLLLVGDADFAMRTMVLSLAVGTPLAIRWTIREVRADMVWLAILSIPLVQGRLMYKAYANFQLGMALLVVAVGIYLRILRRRPQRFGRWLALFVLVTLVYLSHALAFVLLVLFLSAALLDAMLHSRRGGNGSLKTLSRNVAPLAAVLVVPIVLYLRFQFTQTGTMSFTTNPVTRILNLPFFAVAFFSEIVFAVLSALLLGVLLVFALRIKRSDERFQAPGFLIAAAILLVVYLAVPDVIGDGGDILFRLPILGGIALILWLSHGSFPRKVTVAVVGLAAVAIVGTTATRLSVIPELDNDMSEYLSGRDAVQGPATILPLFMSEEDLAVGVPETGRSINHLVELAGQLTVDGDLVDLHHLTPALDIVNFEFAAGMNIRDTAPESACPRASCLFVVGPEMVDPFAFEESGQGRVDYIWLWGRSYTDPSAVSSTRARRIMNNIEAEYELIHVSDEGRLEVYEHR